MSEILLEFYAVRNKEGNWFRAKGYRGYGDTWVSDLRRARIYNRIGPARAQVTYFTKTWPDYGIPDIVKFDCTTMIVLNEAERVNKTIKKAKLEKEKRKVRQSFDELTRVKKQLEENQKRFESLREELGL